MIISNMKYIFVFHTLRQLVRDSGGRRQKVNRNNRNANQWSTAKEPASLLKTVCAAGRKGRCRLET